MLYSIYNVTQKRWATSTNFSTKAEAARLHRIITAGDCRDTYEVRGRKFGTIKD